jgi:hypothetical protein
MLGSNSSRDSETKEVHQVLTLLMPREERLPASEGISTPLVLSCPCLEKPTVKSPTDFAGNHLMKQFANPTIRDRRHHHTLFFTVRQKTIRHRSPLGIVSHQTMSRLDQNKTQQVVARLNQTARRRFAAARMITRTYCTKMSELLACPKTIKATDHRTHRHRRNDTDARLTQKLFDDGVVRNIGLHFFSDGIDFSVKVSNRLVVISQQKQKVGGSDIFRIK